MTDVHTREAVVIVLLTLAGGSMVAAANFSRSYVPLFFAWVAFLGIPLALGRIGRPD